MRTGAGMLAFGLTASLVVAVVVCKLCRSWRASSCCFAAALIGMRLLALTKPLICPEPFFCRSRNNSPTIIWSIQQRNSQRWSFGAARELVQTDTYSDTTLLVYQYHVLSIMHCLSSYLGFEALVESANDVKVELQKSARRVPLSPITYQYYISASSR